MNNQFAQTCGQQITEKLEKPAVKNIPSSFKRLWALQVPSLQNKVNWDNWGNWGVWGESGELGDWGEWGEFRNFMNTIELRGPKQSPSILSYRYQKFDTFV